MVPSVHFWTFFAFFLSKRRCSSKQMFSMKSSKSPLSIFLSTDANLEIKEKKADLWDAKNWRPIWLKKNFFWLFQKFFGVIYISLLSLFQILFIKFYLAKNLVENLVREFTLWSSLAEIIWRSIQNQKILVPVRFQRSNLAS